MNPALVIRATSLDDLEQKLAGRPNYYVEGMCQYGCFIVCVLRERETVFMVDDPPVAVTSTPQSTTVSTKPQKSKR